MMGAAQREAIKKIRRQAYVTAAYRWLIEVAFLFAAFTAFPDYKLPIGLGLLVFVGGVQAIALTIDFSHQAANVLADEAERKTRHAIIHAAELSTTNAPKIDQFEFWSEVNVRVEEEVRAQDDPSMQPTGVWKGIFRASGAFVWQLCASLFGIALVSVMTGG